MSAISASGGDGERRIVEVALHCFLTSLSSYRFYQPSSSSNFIAEHGQLALREGALVQLAELAFWGLLALLTYLAFKICEVELVFRYFRRAGRVTGGMSGRRQLRFRRDEREGS